MSTPLPPTTNNNAYHVVVTPASVAAAAAAAAARRNKNNNNDPTSRNMNTVNGVDPQPKYKKIISLFDEGSLPPTCNDDDWLYHRPTHLPNAKRVRFYEDNNNNTRNRDDHFKRINNNDASNNNNNQHKRNKLSWSGAQRKLDFSTEVATRAHLDHNDNEQKTPLPRHNHRLTTTTPLIQRTSAANMMISSNSSCSNPCIAQQQQQQPVTTTSPDLAAKLRKNDEEFNQELEASFKSISDEALFSLFFQNDSMIRGFAIAPTHCNQQQLLESPVVNPYTSKRRFVTPVKYNPSSSHAATITIAGSHDFNHPSTAAPPAVNTTMTKSEAEWKDELDDCFNAISDDVILQMQQNIDQRSSFAPFQSSLSNTNSQPPTLPSPSLALSKSPGNDGYTFDTVPYTTNLGLDSGQCSTNMLTIPIAALRPNEVGVTSQSDVDHNPNGSWQCIPNPRVPLCTPPDESDSPLSVYPNSSQTTTPIITSSDSINSSLQANKKTASTKIANPYAKKSPFPSTFDAQQNRNVDPMPLQEQRAQATNSKSVSSSSSSHSFERVVKRDEEWENELEASFRSIPDDAFMSIAPPHATSLCQSLSNVSRPTDLENMEKYGRLNHDGHPYGSTAPDQTIHSGASESSKCDNNPPASFATIGDFSQDVHAPFSLPVTNSITSMSVRHIKGTVEDEIPIPSVLVFRAIFDVELQEQLIDLDLCPLDQSSFDLSADHWTDEKRELLCGLWNTEMSLLQQKCQDMKRIIFDSTVNVMRYHPIAVDEVFGLEFPTNILPDSFYYNPSNQVHERILESVRFLKNDGYGKPSVISGTGMHQLQPSTEMSKALFQEGRSEGQIELFNAMIQIAVCRATIDSNIENASLCSKLTFIYTVRHSEQAPHRDYTKDLLRDRRRLPITPWSLDMPLTANGLLLNIWPRHELAQITSNTRAQQEHALPYTLDVSFRQVLLFSGDTVHGGGFQRRQPNSSKGDGCFRMHMYLSFAPKRRTHGALEGQDQVELGDDDGVKYFNYLLKSDGNPF